MSYNLALSHQAEETIYETALWYEQQKHGLGDEFIEAIEIALLSIKSHPVFYSFARNNIRAYSMKRFPYKIFFLIDKEEILIMSIFHTSRKPNI